MVAGAAGDDLDRHDPREQVGSLGSESLLEHAPACHAFLQGLCHGARLFVDLLLHVVAEGALLHGVRGQLALADRAMHVTIFAVVDVHADSGDTGGVAFLQEDEPARHRQERGDVGRDEVLADAEPDHDRAALAGDHDTVGIGPADDGERIGALQSGDGLLHGVEQVFGVVERRTDQVGDDLRVRLGAELAPCLGELVPQGFEVFDDAVVDQRHVLARHVRVRVALAGDAMRRPSGVSDAAGSAQRLGRERVGEDPHLALGPVPPDASVDPEDGDAGGVVSTVFEAPQALHQDRDDVALSDRSDDSTHAGYSPGFDLRTITRCRLPRRGAISHFRTSSSAASTRKSSPGGCAQQTGLRGAPSC